MAKVLVTGGAGFIGSHVAEAYLERGDEVVILDNLSSGKRENIPAAAEFLEMDIRDPAAGELIRRRRFDLINHHAAQLDVRVSVADPRLDASINVDGLLNLLEAARDGDVGRFLFVSSGGVVYGEPEHRPTAETSPKLPESPYGVSKLAGEQYLYYYSRVHGLDYAALRYSNVYGLRQNPHGEAGVVAIFCSRLLEEKPITVFGDGAQTRDYVFVGDVVAANMAVSELELEAPTSLDARAYNVGTSSETSVNALADAVMNVAGVRTEVTRAPGRPGELLHSSLNTSKLQSCGWRAGTSLEEGLLRTWQWMKETGGTGK